MLLAACQCELAALKVLIVFVVVNWMVNSPFACLEISRTHVRVRSALI